MILLAFPTQNSFSKGRLGWQVELGLGRSEGGHRYSNATDQQITETRYRGLYSPVIGVHRTLDLGKHWGLRAGLQYQRSGFIGAEFESGVSDWRHTIPVNGVEWTQREKTKLVYTKLSLPVMGSYFFNVREFRLGLGTGFHMNYLLNGRYSRESFSQQDTLPEESYVEVENPFEAGDGFWPTPRVHLQGSFAFSVAWKRWDINVSVSYGRNLSYYRSTGFCIITGAGIRNDDTVISLRYRFGK